MKALFTSSVGRFTLCALVLLGAVSGAKLYYDNANVVVSEEEGKQIRVVLANAIEQLKEHVDRQQEGKPPYPAQAGWSPAGLICGAPATASKEEASHPTWKTLGMDLSAPGYHQFLFRSDASKFELIARSDFDCDGIFQVYRINGSHGFTGLSVAPISIDNPGE